MSELFGGRTPANVFGDLLEGFLWGQKGRPLARFTAIEVVDLLREAGLPAVITAAGLSAIGLTPLVSQRDQVVALYAQNLNVDAIFEALGRDVPKSSIRAHLSRATATGEIDGAWRQGRGRRVAT